MRNISKAAKSFAVHNLHYNVSYESVVKYLKSIEYTIVYFENSNSTVITAYKMTKAAEQFNAFTIRKGTVKLVFIKSNLTENQKLYAILHETGHIILEHLSYDSIPQDNRFNEMEAETFAYEVLHYKPNKYRYAFIIAIALSVLLGIVGINYHLYTVKQDDNMVYITSSGSCYHEKNCIYIKDTVATALSELEAQKDYKPCKVCNP